MDTKTLLLLAGAGGVFWYIRNKQAAANTGGSTAANYNAGAVNYQQQLPVASNPSPAGTSTGSWFDTATGFITGATGVVQAGTAAWGDIKDAFGSHASASTNGNVWAGPVTYNS